MTPSPRNRTLTLSPDEADALKSRLAAIDDIRRGDFLNRTICADLLEVLPLLPDGFADLIVCDPPYNLSKNFGAMEISGHH